MPFHELDVMQPLKMLHLLEEGGGRERRNMTSDFLMSRKQAPNTQLHRDRPGPFDDAHRESSHNRR